MAEVWARAAFCPLCRNRAAPVSVFRAAAACPSEPYAMLRCSSDQLWLPLSTQFLLSSSHPDKAQKRQKLLQHARGVSEQSARAPPWAACAGSPGGQ